MIKLDHLQKQVSKLDLKLNFHNYLNIQILIEWLNWALSKPLVLPRGYEPSTDIARVQHLDEDLRDGGTVLEVIMRLEQERRRGEWSASDANNRTDVNNRTEALGVIEYKKRPKSEKFKLHK